MSRAETLAEAANVARTIADRYRTKAAGKTIGSDDRAYWNAHAAGAYMVALKLTELADAAARPAAPAGTDTGGKP